MVGDCPRLCAFPDVSSEEDLKPDAVVSKNAFHTRSRHVATLAGMASGAYSPPVIGTDSVPPGPSRVHARVRARCVRVHMCGHLDTIKKKDKKKKPELPRLHILSVLKFKTPIKSHVESENCRLNIDAVEVAC